MPAKHDALSLLIRRTVATIHRQHESLPLETRRILALTVERALRQAFTAGAVTAANGAVRGTILAEVGKDGRQVGRGVQTEEYVPVGPIRIMHVHNSDESKKE